MTPNTDQSASQNAPTESPEPLDHADTLGVVPPWGTEVCRVCRYRRKGRPRCRGRDLSESSVVCTNVPSGRELENGHLHECPDCYSCGGEHVAEDDGGYVGVFDVDVVDVLHVENVLDVVDVFEVDVLVHGEDGAVEPR